MDQNSAWIPVVSGSMLASLGLARRSTAGYALAAVGGALLFKGAQSWTSKTDRRPQYARGVMVKKTIRVAASPERCYQFWRKLANLPQFMEHIESIRILDDKRSHWRARAGGAVAEWDAEIITDRPDEIIGWRSLPGSQVATAGSVRFEPVPVKGAPGTKVRVVLKYNPPGGSVMAAFLNLLGDSPETQISKELQRFRNIVEAATPPESDALVETASEDSFPASDAPAWTTSSAR